MTHYFVVLSLSLLAFFISPSGAERGSISKQAKPSQAAARRDADSKKHRVVRFTGGKVVISKRGEEEHVKVFAGKELEAESVCWAETGTYDEFHSFFETFRTALDSGKPEAVSSLVNFPLRVNGKKNILVHDASELLRLYSTVFTEHVRNTVHGAEPAAVFCRQDAAMIDDGVVWASRSEGRIGLDVVNE